MKTFWAEQDWKITQEHFKAWWNHQGLILCVTAPRDTPLADLPEPPAPPTIEQRWTDPEYRARKGEYDLAHTFFGADAFPYLDTQIGPGNLATFLGSEPLYDEETVWYQPAYSDPSDMPPLRFDPDNPYFKQQEAIIRRGLEIAEGRFLVGIPDLIENMDILASLRDISPLLMDMMDRPDYIPAKIAEINQVYFEVFDRFYEQVKGDWGGNAFSAFRIWGPGKTAKVQCDASAMFSPAMFKKFVLPALTEQCEWLDYSMYHLDGTQAIVHLKQLLDIEPLHAIEWTPQAGIERGGHPRWYDLYRQILSAGKSVQAIEVLPDEVIPLLDAVGPAGMFIMVEADSEAQARALIEQVEPYR